MNCEKQNKILKIHFVCIVLFYTGSCFSQVKNKYDTSFFLADKKGLLGKLGKSISVNNPSFVDSSFVAIRNIDPFILYRGSIIRKINIVRLEFGQSVNDTSAQKKKNFFNDLGEHIHKATKESFIRNNLFFKEGDSLHAFLLADNERFLRDQSYLQDARISVKEDAEDLDYVDVTVYYKDVFSISGSGDAGNGRSVYFDVQDDNFLGSGKRLRLFNLYDLDRKSKEAFGIEYLKRNIAGTFANLTLGYQGNAPAFNSGRREETSIYSLVELPLVSPYYLWTGAFEASLHYNKNSYLNDSTFFNLYSYRYKAYDFWIGYNVSAKRLYAAKTGKRENRFITLRIAKTDFYEVPNIYKNVYNFQYANQLSFLGGFTTFKQEYYRANFIYGFGRNEDIPEGYNASIITGWTNKENYQRPYIGIDLQKFFFSKNKDYYNYELKVGGFLYNGQLQDISSLLSLESFTKLKRLGKSNWLVRHFLGGSFTQLYNNFLNQSLLINSNFGIPEFATLYPKQYSTRFTVNTSSVFYNTWKFVGFSFAPFIFGNITYLRPPGEAIANGEIYGSLGSGIRTRNENLVLGTIELKVQYFPKTIVNMSPWNIQVQTDLKFRYTSQFLKRPDFVTAN